jgi:Holliday junction resolvase RusA-like endonuclease
MKFFVKCNPPRSTAQSSKRVGVRKDGKPFSYTTQKGKQHASDFASLLLPHVPETPLKGSLKLTIIYKLPFLKTEKREVKERGWAYHFKKPDCDNLIKLFQDTMGRLSFWNDDAQVVELGFMKIRHSESGIYVEVEEISE